MTNELEKLREIINAISPNKKAILASETLGNIMFVLAKHFTKIAGYSVASTVLQREIREIGKKDAKTLAKILNIKEVTLQNASKLLRAAAFIFGLELSPKGEHSIVTDCPFSRVQGQPLICKICLEYNKGILEGFAGDRFKFTQIKSLGKGDEYCEFETTEK